MADVNQTLINSRRAHTHTHNAIAILLVVGMRRGGKKETRRIADYSCSFIDSCLPSSRITLRRAWISFARSPCHFWEKEKNNTSQTCFFFFHRRRRDRSLSFSLGISFGPLNFRGPFSGRRCQIAAAAIFLRRELVAYKVAPPLHGRDWNSYPELRGCGSRDAFQPTLDWARGKVLLSVSFAIRVQPSCPAHPSVARRLFKFATAREGPSGRAAGRQLLLAANAIYRTGRVRLLTNWAQPYVFDMLPAQRDASNRFLSRRPFSDRKFECTV